MTGAPSFVAFLAALAVAVSAFGGLVLPRLAVDDPPVSATAEVVVLEQQRVWSTWNCPEHERPNTRPAPV